MANSLPDHSTVEVWTIRPGTMARGWAARVQGPVSALDLEVVPVFTLYDIYKATSDGIPLPFGTWMTDQGPSSVLSEVQELRDAYDTTSEQRDALATAVERYKALTTVDLDRYDRLAGEVERLKAENDRHRAELALRDDALYAIHKISARYEAHINRSPAADEGLLSGKEGSDGAR